MKTFLVQYVTYTILFMPTLFLNILLKITDWCTKAKKQLKMVSETDLKSELKISGMVSNFKFRLILGQISNFSQDWELIYQNDAHEVKFPKKEVARSAKVTRRRKSKLKVKNQILTSYF